MTSPPGADTPGATAAVAQTRDAAGPTAAERAPDGAGRVAGRRAPIEGVDFLVGPRVARAAEGQPYERRAADPIYRPLRVYALDPAASRLDGAVTVVNVPFEPLSPGPRGAMLEVDNFDAVAGVHYAPVQLENPDILLTQGREPSPSDPRFHQQMVYAVGSTVYASFKQALGRSPAWGFERGHAQRLRLRPHATGEANAYYDKEAGELCFGYYRADDAPSGRNLPHGYVFTCLSHDVVAHEMSHALLDGLRAQLARPTNPDVLAFHEAFADLVAVFQRFTYREVVRAAIRASRGDVSRASLLTAVATQFGQTTGSGGALRSAVSDGIGVVRYDPSKEPHELGTVLVTAVFEAFSTVFARKVAPYVRLATGGTGVLPAGELATGLVDVLADEAGKLASQFLSICIRGIDYCPPVDLEFGEFLRAVLTADRDLVPDDPWNYREAWIDAFRRHGIYPRDVANLSEYALLWRPTPIPVPEARELSFARLAFDGDPGRPAGAEELRRQARALAAVVADPAYTSCFGCAPPGSPGPGGDVVHPPCIESVRSSRRIGPDGQVVFDLVAEVTQRREVRDGGAPALDFYGGATVILDPRGAIRYAVSKRVLAAERLARQRAYVAGGGRRYWSRAADGRLTPKSQAFRLLHQRAPVA